MKYTIIHCPKCNRPATLVSVDEPGSEQVPIPLEGYGDHFLYCFRCLWSSDRVSKEECMSSNKTSVFDTPEALSECVRALEAGRLSNCPDKL